MPADTLTSPRLRVRARRRRPPSGRRLLNLCWIGCVLTQLTISTIRVLRGEALEGIFAVFQIGVYLCFRFAYRLEREKEARGIPSRPVMRAEWAILGCCWLTSLVGAATLS